MDRSNYHTKAPDDFWMRFAAQMLNITSFAGVVGIMAGLLVAGFTAGFTTTSILAIGLSGAVGVASVLGNTYLSDKIEAAKKEKNDLPRPQVVLINQTGRDPQKQFVSAIETERSVAKSSSCEKMF